MTCGHGDGQGFVLHVGYTALLLVGELQFDLIYFEGDRDVGHRSDDLNRAGLLLTVDRRGFALACVCSPVLGHIGKAPTTKLRSLLELVTELDLTDVSQFSFEAHLLEVNPVFEVLGFLLFHRFQAGG